MTTYRNDSNKRPAIDTDSIQRDPWWSSSSSRRRYRSGSWGRRRYFSLRRRRFYQRRRRTSYRRYLRRRRFIRRRRFRRRRRVFRRRSRVLRRRRRRFRRRRRVFRRRRRRFRRRRRRLRRRRRRLRRTRRTRRRSRSQTDYFKVKKGQFTFNVEGKETKGAYFSRKLHVPSGGSGATIGRGYDMSERSKAQIIRELKAAGISNSDAKKLSGLSRLTGNAATRYIKKHSLQNLVITPQQQKKLFQNEYRQKENMAKGFSKNWGKGNGAAWNNADKKLKAMFVDLIYRGDWDSKKNLKGMKAFRKALTNNNLQEARKVICDKSNWSGLATGAPDRYKQRGSYLTGQACK